MDKQAIQNVLSNAEVKIRSPLPDGERALWMTIVSLCNALLSDGQRLPMMLASD